MLPLTLTLARVPAPARRNDAANMVAYVPYGSKQTIHPYALFPFLRPYLCKKAFRGATGKGKQLTEMGFGRLLSKEVTGARGKRRHHYRSVSRANVQRDPLAGDSREYWIHLRYLRPEQPGDRALIEHRLTQCAPVRPAVATRCALARGGRGGWL